MPVTKITLSTAMRARDVSRPHAEHLAEAADREEAATHRPAPPVPRPARPTARPATAEPVPVPSPPRRRRRRRS
ncbi:MAG TPA: hypothetical protein VIZ43_26255 [Trebonia sp.]